MKKHVIVMAQTFLFIIGATAQNVSVETAANKGMITLKIIGEGGHVGDVIKLTAKNNSSAKLDLMVEAGRRLDSENDNEQDILVNRQQLFSLNKGETKTISVSGYCCQANEGSPSKNGIYKIGKMAETKLVKLAKFIDGKKYHSSDIAQDAVWVISDSNPVSSIWSEEDTVQSEVLTKFVCSLLNQPMIAHPKIPPYVPQPPPVQRVKKIFKGMFHYTLDKNALVEIAIYDKDEKVFNVLEKDNSQSPGTYDMSYEVGLIGSPGDKYFVRLKVNGQVSKEFELKF